MWHENGVDPRKNLTLTFYLFAAPALRSRFLHFLAYGVTLPTSSPVSDIKSIGQRVGSTAIKNRGFPIDYSVTL